MAISDAIKEYFKKKSLYTRNIGTVAPHCHYALLEVRDLLMHNRNEEALELISNVLVVVRENKEAEDGD